MKNEYKIMDVIFELFKMIVILGCLYLAFKALDDNDNFSI